MSEWMDRFMQVNCIWDVYRSRLSLTVKLVLDDIVKSLKKEKYKVMVLRRREQEPAGGEGLQQVEQFVGCHHGQALQVGRDCRKKGEK